MNQAEHQETNGQAAAVAKRFADGLVIFDGAMGTEIYRHDVFTNCCYDDLNRTRPKLIQEIHRSYAAAGADVLTTNTFGANRSNLEKYGLREKIAEINTVGARLAREVADEVQRERGDGERVFVAGSIGPLLDGGDAHRSEDETVALLAEQAEFLISGGVDFLFFETLPSRDAMLSAARAMKRFGGFPFVLSVAMTHEGENALGETIDRLFAPLPDDLPQPFALGLNCGLGPDGMLAPIQAARKVTALPLIVQPNAGLPKEFEGRQLYYCSPEYITTYAMRYAQLGVAGIGGCCGTTPAHIAEIVQSVKPLARARSMRSVELTAPTQAALRTESDFASRTRWAHKLANHEWVTSVELVPPRGFDLTGTLEKTKRLAEAGVDAVNLPDGPRASSRIASLAVAERILHTTGPEPILHFCCRDKNLIGMQAELFACALYGVRNILFITGDPPKVGKYPNTKAVFDTDSIGICGVQKRLNGGIDLGGEVIQPATDAVIGVGLDPTSLDGKRERERFFRKVEAGASFAITQSVFDAETFLRFFDLLGDPPIPIIAGVWPLVDMRNANFMQNEVPGVVVPDEIMRRMEAASTGTSEGMLAVGIEIARETIDRIRDRVAGVQVNAPGGNIDIPLAVLKQ